MNSVFAHGVGVDILHLPRLLSLLSRRPVSKLTDRILTATELAEFRGLSPIEPPNHTYALSNPAIRFLAARWTAKEAAYKASVNLIPTTKEQWMGWKNFEILKGPRGEPLLTIRDRGGEKIGNGQVSISHDGDYVIAIAMVQH
ncbi:hypothetical protein TWF106_000984 [Orbilia oligospora]|uniref:4'-phosphopantetheinyl transferase domain-containing protein n=1 Tax=Orbilia oligospora TaxID=2813651 RepID=A0A6G1M5N4_ORBOL|nr:hypothetical protein TWF788_011125 [Orbilia oligospora]KAF3205998.1 hypothetical protein TWF106_000984 [Orbilia oligospora]KAF3216518.1 hypothetical protein TWF191_009006 [Orbilia oligospora]KAF3223576.1 hypothetical protein TWF679_000022 [Orbilia oligospora]KAF3245028.1 hypothetical protein TWF192_007551 [Orbilia oligospora]